MFLSPKKRGKHEKAFKGDGYVYYLDCGHGSMAVCISPNSLNCIHSISANFVLQLYLNKAVKKMYK